MGDQGDLTSPARDDGGKRDRSSPPMRLERLDLSKLDRAAIETQLAKILSSTAFARADRASRFLRYVVGRVLENRYDGLKEYELAVEVLIARIPTIRAWIRSCVWKPAACVPGCRSTSPQKGGKTPFSLKFRGEHTYPSSRPE